MAAKIHTVAAMCSGGRVTTHTAHIVIKASGWDIRCYDRSKGKLADRILTAETQAEARAIARLWCEGVLN